MHNYRWSDLEYVLAVAASGSVAAAARQLDVNHSTVLRRVHAFEDRSGLKIFNRLRSGYQVTTEGELFLDAASSIDEIIQEMDRKIAGTDGGLSGEVSVTTTDSLFPVLVQAIGKLRVQYPQITYRLQVSNVRLNLDRRDSDIAIRASVNPPPHLVGRKISDMGFGIYASQRILKTQGNLPVSKRDWLGVDEPLMQSVAAKWMKEKVPPSRIVFRTGSFLALATLAENGAGFALLPKYIGDSSSTLVETDYESGTPSAELWILSHKDVLASPKIQLVSEQIYRELRKKRHVFEGKQSGN